MAMAARERIPIEEFPCMPVPDHITQGEELQCGMATICAICTGLVAVAHLMLLFSKVSTPVTCVFLGLLWLNVLAAVVGLCGMMYTDPGEIKRNEENCYPMPPEVELRLRTGKSLTDMLNVKDGDGKEGRTYCVRCLVWRPNRPRSHHCRTCGVCVSDFDHHCGFYGRCIAGKGYFGGNWFYFGLVMSAGQCGSFVTAIWVIASVVSIL